MVEKAKILIIDGPFAGNTIKVMYNPTEYSEKYEVKASSKNSKIQFDVVNMPEFSVSLFFDTYEKGYDVRLVTGKIVALIMPTVDGVHIKRPPQCLFLWGGFSYRGIVSKIDQKFTMFLDTGIPVRSELNVTFNSVIINEAEEKYNKIKHSRKSWIVKIGDRLDLIAYKELKDPSRWKQIAEANEITDPLAFPTTEDVGKILIIPE